MAENFDVDLKKEKHIYESYCWSKCRVLCSKLVVYLSMYFSVSKNLQATTLFYKYLRGSAVDEIDKSILCWQHITT